MVTLGAVASAVAWLSWHAWEKHWLSLKRFVPRAGAERRPAPAPVAMPAAALAPTSQ
jgi:hypothetical protein